MEYLIIVLVCFFSSVVGAICGIGGGVIIKPVLDATGVMAVTTVSFLSGCTVLSMSVVSLYKNLKAKHTFAFDKVFATVLALGGVVGGLTGKELYQGIISRLSDSSRVGAIQAFVLMVITVGTLLYTIFKEKIHTYLDKKENVPDTFFPMLNDIVNPIFEKNGIELNPLESIYYEIAIEYGIYKNNDMDMYQAVFNYQKENAKKK